MTRQLEIKALLGGAWGVVERQEEPVMIHGLPARNFQIASFTNKNDALLFIAAALPNTEQGMNAEFERWTNMEGLDHIDAEELFHELACQTPVEEAEKTARSRRMYWLQNFIIRWEGAEKKHGDAFWNAPVVEAPAKEA